MSEKIFVITGSHRGIGYAMVEILAKTVDGGIIYLTDISEDLGKPALQKLEETLGSSQKSKVLFHQLDVTDESSVKNFADHLKKTHGRLDVLINNAGISMYASNENPFEKAEMITDVNYYGVRRVSRHCIPLMNEGGRIISMCSQSGFMNTATKEPCLDFQREILSEERYNSALSFRKSLMKEKYSQEHVDELVNASDEKVIDEFIENFKKSVKNGNPLESGYPSSPYRVSKTAVIALTMLHHRMYSKKGMKINACCPGYVGTNINNNTGYLTPYEGADTPVYLALDPEAPEGKFVYVRRPIDWY